MGGRTAEQGFPQGPQTFSASQPGASLCKTSSHFNAQGRIVGCLGLLHSWKGGLWGPSSMSPLSLWLSNNDPIKLFFRRWQFEGKEPPLWWKDQSDPKGYVVMGASPWASLVFSSCANGFLDFSGQNVFKERTQMPSCLRLTECNPICVYSEVNSIEFYGLTPRKVLIGLQPYRHSSCSSWDCKKGEV